MKFRKKPVVIDAILFTDIKTVFDWVAQWNPEEDDGQGMWEADDGISKGNLVIDTREGEMTARVGEHWIIRGVEGEFYPCEVRIFEKTYEPAED